MDTVHAPLKKLDGCCCRRRLRGNCVVRSTRNSVVAEPSTCILHENNDYDLLVKDAGSRTIKYAITPLSLSEDDLSSNPTSGIV